MSGDGDLLGKAQSLLEALREKGLHLPNPTRVDGDTDALAGLAEDVRAYAVAEAVSMETAFDANGALRVVVSGDARGSVAVVEARAFAPWRDEPQITRAAFAAAKTCEVRLHGIERDGPVNVVLRDAAEHPLAWRTVDAHGG